jgi:outer membrane protein assembly factor BamB
MSVRVTASPAKMTVLWRSSSDSSGPPIVAGSLVWTISQGGVLYGLDRDTGKPLVQFSIGSVANHFPTPSIGDGLLLAPSADRVHAFG